MIFTRRHFGAASLTALAMAGAGSASCAAQTATYRNEVTGYGALRRDPAGFFDLPTGFSYRVISREGAAMADGFITPGKFDGMGCIPLGGNRVALIRNHELKPGDNAAGPSGGAKKREERLAQLPVFGRDSKGRVLPGGTTTLVYNLRSRRSEMEYLSLAGTAVNCAGGITPWGSWLSCEETTLTAPQTQTSHGWVFEVPAARRGLADPVPLKAMGRFRHEAAAVDPASGIVYLTEDRDDGLLYRFLPASRGQLGQGGRLQALAFADASLAADSRNWKAKTIEVGVRHSVRWIDCDDVESPQDDLRLQGHAAGAVRFARGEGIHIGLAPDGTSEFFFTCTSGGDRRHGQIFRYRPGNGDGGSLELFAESADPLLMDYADNIAVAPWGHLIVCEDRTGTAINHLKGVTPAGKFYTIARLNAPTELAGACFSPDGETLFVNAYSPGRTLAINGPWRRFSDQPV